MSSNTINKDTENRRIAKLLRLQLIKSIWEIDSMDTIGTVFNSLEKKVRNRLIELRKKSDKDLSCLNGFGSEKVKEMIKSPSDDLAKIFKIKKDRFETFLLGSTGAQKDNLEYYALCVNCDGVKSFMLKYGLSEESNIPDNIFDEDNTKSKKLKSFFTEGCYLYVFDQEAASLNTKELEHFPKLDVLVLKRDKDKFTLLNIGGDEGVKRNYSDGIIEWGDIRKQTFNINFKGHKRNLYMRFHISDLKKEPELIIGKFIFSQGSVRRVVSGSVIICRNEIKLNGGNNLKVELPFTYNYKTKENEDKVPLQIQEYFFDKRYNWQKTPTEKFTLSDLDKWLADKAETHYTKKRIVKYDFLISYPVTSLEMWDDILYKNTDKTKKKSILPEIENILLNGIKTDSRIEYGLKDGMIYNESTIKGINTFLTESYDGIDDSKNKILIYPKHREQDLGHKNVISQQVSLEFFKMIRESFNIVFIIPKFDFSKIEKLVEDKELNIKKLFKKLSLQRASSVYTFIGYCVALEKRVFILSENDKVLPILLQKRCENLGIYVKSYTNINEIPFRINEELKGVDISYKRD